jgi:hypothetical protein
MHQVYIYNTDARCVHLRCGDPRPRKNSRDVDSCAITSEIRKMKGSRRPLRLFVKGVEEPEMREGMICSLPERLLNPRLPHPLSVPQLIVSAFIITRSPTL